MTLYKWSKSELEYGRRILNSGLKGARSGGEAFLKEQPTAHLFSESAKHALRFGAVGACVGAIASLPDQRNRSLCRTLTSGFVGGLLAFGVGLAWSSRHLLGSVLRGALKDVDNTLDAHWVETHPIDFA